MEGMRVWRGFTPRVPRRSHRLELPAPDRGTWGQDAQVSTGRGAMCEMNAAVKYTRYDLARVAMSMRMPGRRRVQPGMGKNAWCLLKIKPQFCL